jgi:hypothetical protein
MFSTIMVVAAWRVEGMMTMTRHVHWAEPQGDASPDLS